MIVSRFIGACFGLLFCFAVTGCDTGGSAPETITDQSELEAFLAENPDVDAEADTGEEVDADQ
tara:strand:- start:123746 stop:123934 length:189 start_codon:yes stop_codon:yes gene_type:complete